MPNHNCTIEYMHEINRFLKESVSDYRNQVTSASRKHHISTKHLKAQLRDFTVIDRARNTLHHQAKEAPHFHTNNPSLNKNIGKVRISSVFNKLLKPHTQIEQPHSSILTPKRGIVFTLSFNTKYN